MYKKKQKQKTKTITKKQKTKKQTKTKCHILKDLVVEEVIPMDNFGTDRTGFSIRRIRG
jgi:hypothetical protein